MRVFLLVWLTAMIGTEGFDLSCSYQHSSFDYAGYIYTCVDIYNNDFEEAITSVYGNTEPRGDIFGFSAQSYSVRSFPGNLSKFLPNLVAITIQNGQMWKIKKSDLQDFSSLEELNLASNKIEVIPDALFIYNEKLMYVNFNNNPIKAVGNNLVAPGVTIQTATFSEAGCIGHVFSDFDEIPRGTHSCLTPEQMMKDLFEDNVNEYEQKNSDLVSKLLELESFYNSCDGSLNAATKNMLISSKRLQSCSASSEISARIVEAGNVSFNCEISLEGNCKVSRVDIPFAGMTIDVVDIGKPNLEASSLIDVNISWGQVLFLPTNLAEKFPLLENLTVEFSALTEIDRPVLQGMENLRTLKLKGNKIHEIPVDAMSQLISLERLDLSLNRIEQLEAGVFASLESLEELNLSGNLLTSLKVDVIENLASLKVLDLGNNKLEFIGADLLSPFISIETVNLMNNTCINISFPEESKEVIEERLIDNCVLPVVLDCTRLDNVGSCQAQNLTIQYPKTEVSEVILADGMNNGSHIISLKMNDQSIKYFPRKLSRVFPNIETIEVVRSSLTAILLNDFEGCKVLKKLVIAHNNISRIDESVFEAVEQLEYLDLSSNEIVVLPSKIFLPLKSVRTLILSSNQITKFTADFLPLRNTIEFFRVEHNKLEMIETKTLRYLRRAKVIDFSGNVCIDMKFDKTENSTRALVELSGEIDLNCSSEDYQ